MASGSRMSSLKALVQRSEKIESSKALDSLGFEMHVGRGKLDHDIVKT